MSIEQDREYFYLNQLAQSPGQALKKFAGTVAKPKELGLDGPTKKNLESRLIAHGYISVSGKGPAKQFTLTESGAKYLATLSPPLPEPPPPKLKAFVLMTIFSAGDAHLTPKQIKAQLNPANSKLLGLPKDGLTPVLASLVAEHAVTETATESPARDEAFRYRLTETGKREILRCRQHVDVDFKLRGSVINQLIEHAAAGTSGTSATPQNVATLPIHATVVRQANTGGTPVLTEDDLIREAKGLMPSLGRNGLLPIFELRRHLRRKFGERAVSHEEFDLRLKRMRGGRLDLVSVAEPSMVGREELHEGVQGVGELFFYLRDLR